TVQANLVRNFPIFINVLKSLPTGLPNVHIAVVSQDMGAGAFTSTVDGCTAPDFGNFIFQRRAATQPICGSASIHGGLHFIESFNGGTKNNFTGDLSDVFTCIAQLGASGCGFEHQLEGVRVALGDPKGDAGHGLAPVMQPAGNAGFLRDDAYLAIV